ncbi:unnamed protein product, partial [Mesorhabditis belari]|uniref:Uncharacterized protein n=1 Tax=Mesorhabditis belari TaxID=2138241 RepID=A0AAF3F0M4_9BILA
MFQFHYSKVESAMLHISQLIKENGYPSRFPSMTISLYDGGVVKVKIAGVGLMHMYSHHPDHRVEWIFYGETAKKERIARTGLEAIRNAIKFITRIRSKKLVLDLWNLSGIGSLREMELVHLIHGLPFHIPIIPEIVVSCYKVLKKFLQLTEGRFRGSALIIWKTESDFPKLADETREANKFCCCRRQICDRSQESIQKILTISQIQLINNLHLSCNLYPVPMSCEMLARHRFFDISHPETSFVMEIVQKLINFEFSIDNSPTPRVLSFRNCDETSSIEQLFEKHGFSSTQISSSPDPNFHHHITRYRLYKVKDNSFTSILISDPKIDSDDIKSKDLAIICLINQEIEENEIFARLPFLHLCQPDFHLPIASI